MATTLGDLLMRVGLDISGLQTQSEILNKTVAETAKKMERVFGDPFTAAEQTAAQASRSFEQNFQIAFKQAEAADKAQQAAVAAAQQRLQGIGQAALATGAAWTVSITTPIVNFANKALDASMLLGSLRAGLDSVTGSSAETAKQWDRLVVLAKMPGMGLPEVAQASINLQGAGTAAEKAEKWIGAFGNALALAGKGREDLAAVVTQLQQMANKSNVLAADLRPVMDRIPQLGKALKDTFGTIDTEEISKKLKAMGWTTQDFIDWMAGEMKKLPTATGTLKNAFESLDETTLITWAKIGDAITPVIIKAAPLIENLLGYVGQLADWFGGLPDPVKNAALAFAAVVAAAGPILVAIGGIMLLPISGTMIAWAAGIAGVVAALAAFGTWVASNWDSIVAVVLQAWGGVLEFWTGTWNFVVEKVQSVWEKIGPIVEMVFGPLILGFTTIWDGVSAAWKWAWENISSMVTGIWSTIMKAAAVAWDAVVGTIAGVLEWIKKNVPGMEKLLTLDKAWDGATKLTEAQEDLEKQVKKTGEGVDETGPKFDGVTGKTKLTEAQMKKLRKEQEKAAEVAYKQKEQLQLLDAQLLLVANSAERKAVVAFEKTVAESAKLTTKIQGVGTELKDLTDDKIPKVIAQAMKLPEPFDAGWEAMDAFGLKSAEEMASITADAKAAYEALVASGRATEFQQDSAYLKVLQTMADETEATTGNIPIQLQRALDEMNAKVNDPNYGLPKTQVAFQNTFTMIGDGLSGITNNTLHSLIHGDLDSLKDLGNTLKQLGLDALSTFAQPFIDAITGPNGLIQKGINVLMDKLIGDGGLMGVIGGLFGGGGGGANIAGLATSGGNLASLGIPGLGQAAGGTTSAVGGIVSSGLLSTIFGGISAGAAVANLLFGYGGLFGQAEGDGDVLNKHTLQTANELANLRRDQWEQTEKLYWDAAMPSKNLLEAHLPKIDFNTYWSLIKVSEISENTFWSLQKLSESLLKLDRIGNALSDRGEFHFYLEMDGKTIATAVGDRLNEKLRLA